MSPCVVIDASRGLLTVGGQTLLCAEADDSGRRRVGGNEGPLVRPLSFGVRSALVASAIADPAPESALRALVVTATMLDAGQAPATKAFLAAAVAGLALSGAGVADLPFALCRRLLSERGGLDDTIIDRITAVDADRLAVALSSGNGQVTCGDGGWRQFVLTDSSEASVPLQTLDEISLELARALLERGRDDVGTHEAAAGKHSLMTRSAVSHRRPAMPPTAPAMAPAERWRRDPAPAGAEAASSAVRVLADAAPGSAPVERQGAEDDKQVAQRSTRRDQGSPAGQARPAGIDATEARPSESAAAPPSRPRARFTIVPSAAPVGLAQARSPGFPRPKQPLPPLSSVSSGGGSPEDGPDDRIAETIEVRQTTLDPFMNLATPAQAAGQAFPGVRLPATRTFAAADPIQPNGWRASSAAVAIPRQTVDRAALPLLPAASLAADSPALSDDLADALATLLNDEADLRGID